MADGGFDFNQLAMRMGMGQQKAGDDMPGNEDFLDTLKGQAGKLGGMVSKFFGLNLEQAGQTSLTQPIDSEGLGNKNIPSLVSNLNANGGIIARILSVLTKNGVITDQTQGTGGGDAMMASLGNLSPSFATSDLPPMPTRDTGAGMEVG